MTWKASSYFAKVQLYWSRATATERESDQFLLNVAFACEFLIRGALTQVNPALNAAVNDDSILYASGLAPERPAKSADLNIALKRLQKLMPDLTKSEVDKIETLIDARNSELHSDLAEMSKVAANDLMPSVFSFIVQVAGKSGQDLQNLLGEEDAKHAIAVATAIKKDRKRRVDAMILAFKERFFTMPKDEQSECREKAKTEFESAVLKTGHHLKREKCPACAEPGMIVGVPVGRSSPILRGQEILEEVRISPISFECKCCGLVIKGLDELLAAGFSHEYHTMDEKDPFDHLGIDPLDHIDIEEVVREYAHEVFEYQDE